LPSGQSSEDGSVREPGLIARARANDPQAWAELYAEHHALVYRYVRARVFDETIAEDLASTVFLAALQSITSYRETGRPFLAWLYGIARNTVADHQRKAASQGRLRDRVFSWRDRETPATETEDIGTSMDDPGASVERLDLRRAIAQLPEAQREVVILRHFVGFETAEIAAAMKKAPSAVYSLEARALESLRRQMRGGPKEISAATDEKQPIATISK
jgi:RNA polymerase sigma-70 factor, ECF subfamily